MENEDREFYRQQAMRLRRLGWDWRDVMVGHRRLERLHARLEAWCDAGHEPITVEEWRGIVQSCRAEETRREGGADAKLGDTVQDGNTATEGNETTDGGGKASSEVDPAIESGNNEDGPIQKVNEAMPVSGPVDIMERVEPSIDDDDNDDAGRLEREADFESCLQHAPSKVRKLLESLDIKQLQVAMAWEKAWCFSKIVEAPGGYGDETRKALRKWLRSLMAGIEEESPTDESPADPALDGQPVLSQTDDAKKLTDNFQGTMPNAVEEHSDNSFEENVAVNHADSDAFETRVPQEQGEQQRRSLPFAGPTKTINLPGGEKMEMVWCPAGGFTRERGKGEGKHYFGAFAEVSFPEGFWMAKFPVTQAQWRSVMGGNPSHFPGDNRPVESVCWEECQEFCQKAGLRLPTEAEWEYACRAGRDKDDTGAGKLDDFGWWKSNSEGETHPVGEKRPNDWGLFDMYGNVLEWCADQSSSDSNKDAMPLWPSEDPNMHLARGGSWEERWEDAKVCWSSERRCYTNGVSLSTVGFRPVSSHP